MKIQNTTLRITTDPTTIYLGTDVFSSTAHVVHTILVGRNRTPHASFSDFKNLTATDNFAIEYQDTDGNIRDIQLPETIRNGLIQYLQNSPDIHNSTDCFGFLVEVLGGKRGDRSLDAGKFAYMGEKMYTSLSQLQSGDVLVFCDGTEEGFEQGNFHYAMYLGDDLFISKYGFAGAIFITNFDQIKDLCIEYDYIIQPLLREKL